MEPLSPAEEKQRGLTRERLVGAALELINAEGLDGLSMRSLAEHLDVKASSLYWHVRDRRELVELLAESILEGTGRPRRRPAWREGVLAVAEALARRVSAQKDADRILLEVPEALERSDVFAQLTAELERGGLQRTEAAGVALMVMTYVIGGRQPAEPAGREPAAEGKPVSVAVDSGSRGVILRAGPPDMHSLIRVPQDQSGAAPAVVTGDRVVVRRLRGVGRGELELNPRHPWSFRVQAPTWNTVLDLAGLDVREIWVDSGAANLECFLPMPSGAVPIHVSSGVVNVSIHRERGAAVWARAHTGAVKLRLDGFSTKVAVFDVNWHSEGLGEAADRYELEVSSGAVDVRLDSYEPKVRRSNVPAPPQAAASRAGRKPASALEVLLDGVEARASTRR